MISAKYINLRLFIDIMQKLLLKNEKRCEIIWCVFNNKAKTIQRRDLSKNYKFHFLF